MELNKIFNEDCRETAKKLPTNFLDMIVTSPPYYNLRDYGHESQMGLEQTPEDYVAAMVQLFADLRPALKDTGTLWINIGDTYATTGGARTGPQAMHASCRKYGKAHTSELQRRRNHSLYEKIKQKDLIGIPWMLAFALRADGWYLRQDIIWNKPNPMPESVADRCTKSHEYIFLLSKSEKYYFDNEAIKEAATSADGSHQTKAKGEFEGKNKFNTGNEAFRSIVTRRNKRSVWTVATKPFNGAHFAVYPHELIAPCIMAGTSDKGNCKTCGGPWERILEPVINVGHTGQTETAYDEQSTSGRLAKLRQAAREMGMEYTSEKKTVGWRPTCSCVENEPAPALVFDPFMGSGTTASVAKSLGRNYLGCELNPDFLKVCEERLRKELGLFNQK